MKMKAYVINLDKAKKRWESAKKSLAEAGFEPVRVRAVLGEELQLPHPDYSELSYKLMHGKKTTKNELGCYFSHVKVLKTFLSTNDQFCLVCEDDILCLEPQKTKKLLDAAGKYSSTWDMVRLSGKFHTGFHINLLRLDKAQYLSLYFGRFVGTGAYMVNRKAAKNLLNKLLPMRLPYDQALDRDWRYRIRSMVMNPLPFTQYESNDSFIIVDKSKKYPPYIRYWTVFPYRFYNNICLYLCKLSQLVKLYYALGKKRV